VVDSVVGCLAVPGAVVLAAALGSETAGVLAVAKVEAALVAAGTEVATGLGKVVAPGVA
jgi:hypothetical protein